MATLPEQRLAALEAHFRDDPELVAALRYGSLAKGEGDRFSDVEHWLFFERVPADPEAWVARVAPLRGALWNEFGTLVVLFADGVRGELHFEEAGAIERVRDWAQLDPRNPASWAAEPGGLVVVVDRSGELRRAVDALEALPAARSTPERVQALCDGFTSWALLGQGVLARGEWARALDALSHVQRYLLWMARVAAREEHHHWPTPSRAAERDLPPALLARLQECSARLEPEALGAAWIQATGWGCELMDAFARSHGTRSRAEWLDAGRSGR